MNPDIFPQGYESFAKKPGWAINNKAVELAQAGDYATSYQMLLLAEKAGYKGKELSNSIWGVRKLLGNDALATSIDKTVKETQPASDKNLTSTHKSAADPKTEESLFPKGFEHLNGRTANEIMDVAKDQFKGGHYGLAYHLSLIAEKIGYLFTQSDAKSYDGYSKASEYFYSYTAYDPNHTIEKRLGVFKEAAADQPAKKDAPATEERKPAPDLSAQDEILMTATQNSNGEWMINSKQLIGDGTFGINDSILIRAKDARGNVHEFSYNPDFKNGDNPDQEYLSQAFMGTSSKEFDGYLMQYTIPDGVRQNILLAGARNTARAIERMGGDPDVLDKALERANERAASSAYGGSRETHSPS